MGTLASQAGGSGDGSVWPRLPQALSQCSARLDEEELITSGTRLSSQAFGFRQIHSFKTFTGTVGPRDREHGTDDYCQSPESWGDGVWGPALLGSGVAGAGCLDSWALEEVEGRGQAVWGWPRQGHRHARTAHPHPSLPQGIWDPARPPWCCCFSLSYSSLDSWWPSLSKVRGRP